MRSIRGGGQEALNDDNDDLALKWQMASARTFDGHAGGAGFVC